MTTVFLDTNIILDILNSSREGYWASSAIFAVVKKQHLMANITTQSIIDAAYVFTALSKRPVEDFKKAVEELCNHCTVLSIDKSDIEAAIDIGFADFEDSAQIACALRNHSDYIITSDRKILNLLPDNAVAPEEFYKAIFGSAASTSS